MLMAAGPAPSGPDEFQQSDCPAVVEALNNLTPSGTEELVCKNRNGFSKFSTASDNEARVQTCAPAPFQTLVRATTHAYRQQGTPKLNVQSWDTRRAKSTASMTWG